MGKNQVKKNRQNGTNSVALCCLPASWIKIWYGNANEVKSDGATKAFTVAWIPSTEDIWEKRIRSTKNGRKEASQKKNNKNISDALIKCTKFRFKIDITEIYNWKAYRYTHHTEQSSQRKMWIIYFPFEMREQSLV